MAAVFRRVIAGLILGPALLIGSFAWWGFLALRTVFDESRTETIAEELLDNDAVVEQIGANVGRALEAAMPDAVQLSDEQVAIGVEIILTDPVVRDLIVGALGTTHRAFLGLEDAPATIDLGPALESTRVRLGAFAPTVAEQIPESFVVELPTERIPDASPVKRFLEGSVPLLGGIAVTMALLAFLTTSDRSRVLGKAARWALGTTAFYLIVGLGVPYLIRQFAPDQAEVLAALLTAVLRAALVPSIVLAVVGAVLLVLSMFWPDPARRDEPRRREPARDTRRDPEPMPALASTAPPARRAATPIVPVASPAPRARPTLSTDDGTVAFPAAPAAPRPTPTPPPVTPPPTPITSLPVVPRPSPTPPPPVAPLPTPTPPPIVPPVAEPAPGASRPLLPTRAKPPESVGLPAWTGEPEAETPVAPEPAPDKAKWLTPTWVAEHGWVMDADDPRDPPANARFVEGVGWVVPGPPPD
jgi:hypothetical protein